MPQYVFSRDTNSVEPDYASIAKAGATVALNAYDTRLPEQVAKARQAGAQVAIWIPHHDETTNPTAYAQQMASIVQTYKPDSIIPNVEGSNTQQWSTDMMNEFQKYVAPGSVRMDVAVEPHQANWAFNYQPYLNFGGGVVAESFGADPKTDRWDPQQIHDYLAQQGVPEDKINVLLAPGQQGATGGNYSLYTLDDAPGQNLNTWLDQYATQNRAPQTPTPTSDTRSLASSQQQAPKVAPSNFDPTKLMPTAPWNLAGIAQAARSQATSKGLNLSPALSPAAVTAGVGQFNPAGGQQPNLQSVAQAARAVVAQRPDLAGSSLAPVAGSSFAGAQQYAPVK